VNNLLQEIVETLSQSQHIKRFILILVSCNWFHGKRYHIFCL